MSYKPTFIRLPLHKMAGCPWNLLDDRGMRIAWCGTDNNHEKDGELIANDILNLVAIAEAASELLEKGNAKLAEKDAEIERLKGELNRYAGREALSLMRAQHEEIERLTRELMEVRFEFDQYKTRYSFPSTGLLRERDSRPPTGGVQSGGEDEGAA